MALKTRKVEAKPQPRRQGRPKRSEVSGGREAIVEATRVLLKTMPPAKITRRSVAEAAGVDPALVRYYFGDTTPLLAEVVQAITDHLRGRLEISASAADLSPRERLRQRTRILLETFVENPHYHQLFVELVLQRQSAQVKALRRAVTRRSLGELIKLLDEAGAKDADPRFVYLAMFGILEFFVSGRAVLEELYPAHIVGSRKLQDEYADFVTDLLFGKPKR